LGLVADGKNNNLPVLYPSDNSILTMPSTSANHSTSFDASLLSSFPGDGNFLPALFDNSGSPNTSSSTFDPTHHNAPPQLLPALPLPPIPENSQSALTLKRPRVQSVGETASTVKKSKGPTVNIKVKHLKIQFPSIHTRVMWAKGFYRAQSLIRQPYALRAQKLSLAAEAYNFARDREQTVVIINNPPALSLLITLVSSLR
jgi:hypothetical protein